MIDAITQDAREYGLHVKAGGWRLGLLVARNVTKGKSSAAQLANLRNTKIPANHESDGGVGVEKVSAAIFAKSAGVGTRVVLHHFDAWERAAEAGYVPPASTLIPGVEVEIDAERMPDWGDFYESVTGGRTGPTTPAQAKAVLAQLPPKEAATVITEALATDEIFEAVNEDEDAADHVFHVTTKLAGERGKSAPVKKQRSFEEMTVVLSLLGVLGAIRELAKQDSNSPLIKECKNLMRETLEILDGIEEADDPETVERMLSDFGEFLATQ